MFVKKANSCEIYCIVCSALDNTLLLNNIIKKKLVKRANVGHGSL
jgi:hypothetical protein